MNPEEQLRREAEALLDDVEPDLPAADALLHQLQVQQIEFEMQNENLRAMQIEIERSRDRYRKLYDFSPIAYLTLNDQGLICKANHAGATLLGIECNMLIKRSFAGYVSPEDTGCWRELFLNLLKDEGKCSCDIKLLRHDGKQAYVRVDGRHVVSEDKGITVHIALTDITERYQSEKLLRESEEKLLALFDGSLDGIVLINDNGMIVDCNPEFERQTGRTLEQLRQIPIWELRPPEKSLLAREIFLGLIKSGTDGNASFKYKKPAGNVIHVDVRGTNLLIGGGSYLQCICHDITERRQAEMRLRESEEMLRTIFEGTQDGIILADAMTKRFIAGNPAAFRMLGCSAEEFVNMGVADIHPLQNLPRILEHFESQVKREIHVTVNIPVKRRDGTTFYADITAAPVNIGDRQCLVGVFRDITEQRLAEEKLRSTSLKYQALFESSRDALVISSPPSWKYTGANEAALKLFGAQSVEEFTRLGLWEVSPEYQPDGQLSIEAAQERMASALQQGSYAFEWEHQRLDGRPFTADVLQTRVGEGEKAFLLATVRDISERKQAEIALREHQHLLRALAAQGAASREAELKHVAREVHDELGQLLTALRMDISLLRIQFGSNVPALMPMIKDMLVLVDKAIQGARDVTTNLHPPALDMGIVPAIRWLSDDFSARTAIICTLLVVDEPDKLDDVRTLTLFRIVQESLTNIARHAEAPNVEITIKRRDENIVIEVVDNGKGFDLFEKSPVKSFGLMGMKERALAVCGNVEIASKAGQGTKVSVEIPLFQINPGRRVND